jgi:hypothetical protein
MQVNVSAFLVFAKPYSKPWGYAFDQGKYAEFTATN